MKNSKYIKIEYDKAFIEALHKKLDEMGYKKGYLWSPTHPNVKKLSEQLPVCGTYIAKIIKPRKNQLVLPDEKALARILNWLGLKMLNYHFITEDYEGYRLVKAK